MLITGLFMALSAQLMRAVCSVVADDGNEIADLFENVGRHFALAGMILAVLGVLLED
jgi:hypothetical protein